METSKAIEYTDECKDINGGPVGGELHSKLFYPNAEDLVSYIAEGIKAKDESFFCFNSHEGSVWNVLNHVVQTQFNQSKGKIGLGRLFKAIEDVAKIWELVKFYNGINTTNKSFYEKRMQLVDCQSEDSRLIAVGRLTEDFCDGDSDPYETAGGYRSWKALKGSLVEYRLNKDLTVTLSFDSNCMVDHYNNNIYGMSTGGGTTKYEIGARVKKRSVTLGREAISKDWKKTEIKADIKKIDPNKIMRLVKEYQPELYSAL